MKKLGFTLLELLVVIAIIATLAAILFPVFVMAQRRARQTTCTSNLRQLSTAMTSYADDNNGRLPRWWFEDNSTTWDKAIFPEVNSNEVFECPANLAKIYVPKGATIRSYAFPRNISGMEAASIKNPAATVLLFDKGAQYLFDWNDCTGEFFQQMWSTDTNPKSYPHDEAKMFAFVDGHVAKFHVGEGPFAYAFTNPKTGRPWPVGYCGNMNDPLGKLSNKTSPGANLPL
jgi:prepilin-type N-terminal cleavage/methylation domain-containing protein/prepilin-type processing-associated H-X9-DG protein